MTDEMGEIWRVIQRNGRYYVTCDVVRKTAGPFSDEDDAKEYASYLNSGGF